MDLLVIRHGQSEADILKVIEGRADFNLTGLGKTQATLMAKWVSHNYRITKIFASPLKRASQTALLLSDTTGLDVSYDDDLTEWQNGLIAGLSREEANNKYPLPDIKHPHTAIYEQESDIQFRMRAETVLSRIIYENPPDSTIAIISHGNMINMLFRSFLQLPLISQVYISSGDTGIHRWQISNNSRRILFVNSQVHLAKIEEQDE